MPDDLADARAASCADALTLFDAALTQLPPDDGHRWLHAEIAWSGGMVDGALATMTEPDGHAPDAYGSWERFRARCEAAAPYLADAPVNGHGLANDCRAILGNLGDLPGFLRWSDLWLNGVDWPRFGDRTNRRIILERVVENAHPDCTRDLDTWISAGSRQAWCRTLGTLALGCTQPGVPTCDPYTGCTRDPDVDWDGLVTIAEQPLPHATCEASYTPQHGRRVSSYRADAWRGY